MPASPLSRPRLLPIAVTAIVLLGCAPDVADTPAARAASTSAPSPTTTPVGDDVDLAAAPTATSDDEGGSLADATTTSDDEGGSVAAAPSPDGRPTERAGALADRVRPGPSARFEPDAGAAQAPAPVGLTIDDIAVDTAPVRPVGIEGDGELEVPGADEVGWYRFGSRPGDTGSAVLAAHVAFDGRDGVFRYLADVEPGTAIAVTFADGSARRFEAVSRAQYRKDELPFDEVFRRVGSPTLVLITCGGAFDPGRRSYDDNVVVYAVPTEDA